MIRTLAFLKGVSTKEVTWEDTLAYPWHHVGPDEAEAFRCKIHSGYSNPHTRQNYVATLRTIMRRCKEAKLISAARYAEVVETLPTAAVRAPARNRRRLSSAEIEALMAACRQDIALRAARDSAIIAVFATTGMRVSELTRLDLAHWDRANEQLHLIMTKNGGDHVVPVDERARVYLEEWLVFRGEDPGPLFVQAAGTSNELAALERFAIRGVISRVQEIAERAGIGRVGTHDFRRTVASTLLRTTDAALVGRLLNHANLATTLGYDMATEEEQRTAIRSLPLPLLGAELNIEEEV